MADDREADRAYVSGGSGLTGLPPSCTNAISTMLYDEGGRHSSHMYHIDVTYCVMGLGQGDSRLSPAEFVRRMGALVQHISYPDGEANPQRLRQLIGELGDHKSNEVLNIVLPNNPFCGPSIDFFT